MDDEIDLAFSVLPLQLRRRIDQAFDSATGSPSKTRKLDHSEPSGGGFIVEEPSGSSLQAEGFLVEDNQSGGFVVDEEDQSPSGGFVLEDDDVQQPEQTSTTHIPLGLIPTALQLLDLQPDDEDVLAVFRNAASGWGSRHDRGEGEDEQFVSRKDWRAVCAALLDIGEREPIDGDDDVDMTEVQEDFDEQSSPSGDDYEVSDESGSKDDSDEEYVEDNFISSSKSKGKRKASGSSQRLARSRGKSGTVSLVDSEEEDKIHSTPKQLTPRQKTECRRTFALFFPDIPDKDLDRQKLMIKDITRVAKLLKEKITAEEIVEMLEAFSSSADKSVSLADFEMMMVVAKLA